MGDVIVSLILVAIIGSVSYYIYDQKKKGVKCIGCSHGKDCASGKGGCSGCSGEE